LPRYTIKATEEVSHPPLKEAQFTLEISGLTDAQITFMRCMLEIDYEVDPVKDWGFKRSDGNLNSFRMKLANKLEQGGF